MSQTHSALLQEPRDRLTILHRYRDPHQGRSIFEIVLTVILFAACWFSAWLSLQWSYWLTLIACVPAAGLLVRLFMIQHDCGHGTLFRRRRVNDWMWCGRLKAERPDPVLQDLHPARGIESNSKGLSTGKDAHRDRHNETAPLVTNRRTLVGVGFPLRLHVRP